jgi:hypothetical protein
MNHPLPAEFAFRGMVQICGPDETLKKHLVLHLRHYCPDVSIVFFLLDRNRERGGARRSQSSSPDGCAVIPRATTRSLDSHPPLRCGP